MKRLLTILLFLPGVTAFSQSNPKAVLRQQTFGMYSSISNLQSYTLDSNALVVFSNGYILTREEFSAVFHISGADTTNITKSRYLTTLITAYQRCFEGMDQGLDTTMKFQLDFLTYKQELITPYLNQGKTRPEAEALPEVKYALRRYYVDQLAKMLMNKEVWAPQTDAVLQDYYNNHLSLYQGQPFSISKTKVIFDQQKEKETELNTRVNAKFSYRMNETLRGKL